MAPQPEMASMFEFPESRSGVAGLLESEVISFYNRLNSDVSHFTSTDDICTPMECVQKMLEYIPEEFWRRDTKKILDPCAGNGNFGALCRLRTDESDIWYNELNPLRFANCINLLSPLHATNDDFFALEGSWDLIMANPPYSGGGNKNRGLSNQFIERSIDLLNHGGYLCFVTPNNWMSFNNNNTTLAKLLSLGSFLVIDNDVKKYFPSVGSSFTIFVWQKGMLDNRTLIVNNYLQKDVQSGVRIPANLPFIPLYCSQTILDIIPKLVGPERNRFDYRCDLHNYTQKKFLRDEPSEEFRYKTIHTMRKTRFASKKQDIFEKWNIIVPLSTYYVPTIMTQVNTTQSVGYVAFETEAEARRYLRLMTEPQFKLLIHLTRYGNFNNIKLLKHLRFGDHEALSAAEEAQVATLVRKIPY